MFEVAEYIGIIAFAMSGFFVAVRAKLDFLGVLIAVFLTAFGGGIIRDIIVNKTPYIKESIENRSWFIVSDSIGLVSFSITGALVALESKLNFTGILTLSFVTAVGGGIVRDIIINEVPFVFKTGFYGTVSLLVGALMYLLEMFGFIGLYGAMAVFTLGVGIRVIAYYKKWSIPLM